MRFWKPIATTLIVLAIIYLWSRKWEDQAPRPASPAQEVKLSVPVTPPSVGVPLPAPADTPPAPPAPPTPMPRSEASRASSLRNFENPLVPADTPVAPPPRRAADAGPEIEADFDQIQLMFRDYRTLAGGNPVGTNAEIMKTIMGDNPKSARLGPPEGQKINEKGELIDHWGVPYFFHQLTRDVMEIRSAGPDRRLWNEDDIVGE